MIYEIIGYDQVNGNKTFHKVFKNNYKHSEKEIDEWEEKVRKRKQSQHKEKVEIYSIYRRPMMEEVNDG